VRGLSAGEVAGEAEPAAPAEQVSGGQDHLEPGGVGVEAGEGHAFEPAVLQVADVVLDLGVATVSGFEGERIADAVGQHDLVAPAVVVPEPQLSARVGAFAAHDRPCPLRPAGQGHVELSDLGPASPSVSGEVLGGLPGVEGRLSARRPSSTSGSIRSKVRHTVAAEATSPNRPGWSRNAARSATQRPPPANITATCVRSRPRSWTGERSPVVGTAAEYLAGNPTRSASSPSRCRPANDTV
jgi:hypothetical protein